MAANILYVYVDNNNYVYAYAWREYYLILENELQYIENHSINGFSAEINEEDVSNMWNNTTPTLPLHELTEEEYNQIQAGTFPYGIPSVTSRDSSPVQPLLTYSVNWGTNNVYQKLSGKTYTAPNGQTVDCSTITVTFSSSQHFKKFYATAVKDGNDYGFIDDILVDIRQTNPTGILLHELTSRNADTDFTFTINTSSFAAGDGQYRIGLYVQNDDNIWNYEYFLVDVNNNPIVDSQGNNLQVPVQNQWEYNENNINNIIMPVEFTDDEYDFSRSFLETLSENDPYDFFISAFNKDIADVLYDKNCSECLVYEIEDLSTERVLLSFDFLATPYENGQNVLLLIYSVDLDNSIIGTADIYETIFEESIDTFQTTMITIPQEIYNNRFFCFIFG